MRWQDANFAVPAAKERLGWIVLAAGASLLAGAAQVAQHLSAQVEDARRQVHLREAGRGKATPAQGRPRTGEQVLSRTLGHPWLDFFHAMESGWPPGLVLQSVQARAEDPEVRFVVEADDLSAITRLAAHLRSAGWKRVRLVSQRSTAAADGPVRMAVTMRAEWGGHAN